MDLWPEHRRGEEGLERRMGSYPEEAGFPDWSAPNMAGAVLGSSNKISP